MSKLTIKDAGIVVDITRETRSPSQRGFGACAFVYAVTAITQRIKKYISLADVGTDYSQDSEAYKAAAFWFGSKTSPETFYVIQALATSLAVKAESSFDISASANATGDGKVGISIDGVEFSVVVTASQTPTIVGGLIADLINASGTHSAVNTAGDVVLTDVTGGVLGNAVVLADVSTDTGMTGAVLTQPASGANLVASEEPGTALDAALALDASFYFIALDRNYRVLNASMTSAAVWVGINLRAFFAVSNDVDCIDGTKSTDIVSIFQAANYARVLIDYSSHPVEYPEIGAAAILATTDFDGQDTVKTLKFKDIYLATPEDISPAQLDALKAKNGNTFYIASDIRMFDEGICCSGEFMDYIHGADALSEAIRVGVFGKLASVDTKVPFTEPGAADLLAEVDKPLAAFDRNGFLSDGVDEDGNYLPAYTTASERIYLVSAGDKAARQGPALTFEARDASAIHGVSISGTVVLP